MLPLSRRNWYSVCKVPRHVMGDQLSNIEELKMQRDNRKVMKNSENVRNGRKGGQTTRQLLELGRYFARENNVDPSKPLPARIRRKLAA